MWYSDGYDTASVFVVTRETCGEADTSFAQRPIMMSWGHALKRTACMQRKPNVPEAGNGGK